MQNTLKSLREGMQQLEQQFAAIVMRQQQQQTAQKTLASPFLTLPSTDDHSIGANVPASIYGPSRPRAPLPKISARYEELMSLYTRATLRKEALMREHEQLQRQVDAHGEFERKLQLFAEEQVRPGFCRAWWCICEW